MLASNRMKKIGSTKPKKQEQKHGYPLGMTKKLKRTREKHDSRLIKRYKKIYRRQAVASCLASQTARGGQKQKARAVGRSAVTLALSRRNEKARALRLHNGCGEKNGRVRLIWPRGRWRGESPERCERAATARRVVPGQGLRRPSSRTQITRGFRTIASGHPGNPMRRKQASSGSESCHERREEASLHRHRPRKKQRSF